MPRKIRPIRIDGSLAYVPLTQGYEAVLDAKNAHLVSGFNWTLKRRPHTFYAYRQVNICGKKQDILMHRALMDVSEFDQVDHIDHNGLNNCRSNLRIATHQQNQFNRKVGKNNKSGFKGVSWHKASGRWIASIRASGVTHYLGIFDDPNDAHAAYCDASARLHGEFGRTT
jgi:hypothetical protein